MIISGYRKVPITPLKLKLKFKSDNHVQFS